MDYQINPLKKKVLTQLFFFLSRRSYELEEEKRNIIPEIIIAFLLYYSVHCLHLSSALALALAVSLAEHYITQGPDLVNIHAQHALLN